MYFTKKKYIKNKIKKKYILKNYIQKIIPIKHLNMQLYFKNLKYKIANLFLTKKKSLIKLKISKYKKFKRFKNFKDK